MGWRWVLQGRLFPLPFFIWRKSARGNGAPWELAWIWDGLSCLLLGWTGKGVSGPRETLIDGRCGSAPMEPKLWGKVIGVRWVRERREGCRAIRQQEHSVEKEKE